LSPSTVTVTVTSPPKPSAVAVNVCPAPEEAPLASAVLTASFIALLV